jgi:hypothetical protein
VEDVLAQGCHAKALGDGDRVRVGGGYIGGYVRDVEVAEGPLEGGAARLGGEATATGRRRQDPTDLHLAELGPPLQAVAAEEGSTLAVEQRHSPLAALGPLVLRAPDPFLDIGPRRRAEGLAHQRVLVQDDEVLDIVGARRSHDQPLGLDLHAPKCGAPFTDSTLGAAASGVSSAELAAARAARTTAQSGDTPCLT